MYDTAEQEARDGHAERAAEESIDRLADLLTDAYAQNVNPLHDGGFDSFTFAADVEDLLAAYGWDDLYAASLRACLEHEVHVVACRARARESLARADEIADEREALLLRLAAWKLIDTADLAEQRLAAEKD